MISTYFGKMTIVLKLPLTSAASAKGEQRKRGLPLGVWVLGEGEREGGAGALGVGDLRRGLRLRLENIFGFQADVEEKEMDGIKMERTLTDL